MSGRGLARHVRSGEDGKQTDRQAFRSEVRIRIDGAVREGLFEVQLIADLAYPYAVVHKVPEGLENECQQPCLQRMQYKFDFLLNPPSSTMFIPTQRCVGLTFDI